ncbi:MAG: FG-GAP-like repeat-containing protein [Bacteroidota bacterium]
MKIITFRLILLLPLLWLQPFPGSAQIFTEQSIAMGIDHVFSARALTGGGAAFFDYDNDGDEDLYLTRGRFRDYLYENNGDGTFSRINGDIGLFASVQFNSMAVTTGDIDNDGDRDIFVSTWEMYNGPTIPLGRNLLFLNNGDKTFTEIGLQAGLTEQTFTEGAMFLDYNKDGFLDIFVMNHIENSSFTADSTGTLDGYAHDCFPNFLYRNNGDLTFTEVAQELNVTGINGCTIAGVASDYDMDGDVDIYLANDFGYWLEPNVLYENVDGEGNEFVDVSAATGADVEAFGMGIAAGDYDQDGDIDYYTTSIGRNILIDNNGGQFEDVTEFAGVENPEAEGLNTTGWGTAFFDVDNDALLDLYVANGRMSAIAAWATAIQDPDKLYMNNGDKTFTDVSEEAGVADTDYNRGMAYSDFDNDGDLDIFVVSLEELDFHSKFYVNETENDHHYIQLKLEGVESNRDAYGSKVWLYAGGKTFLREIYGGGDTYASQNTSVVHFGLGEMDQIDSIRIDWPNGHVDHLEALAVDSLHHLVEGIVEPPNATNDLEKFIDLKIAPNPFRSGFSLNFSESLSAKTHLKLTTSSGVLILEQAINSGFQQFDVEVPATLNKGLYFLQITQNNHSLVRKLVKF